MGILGIGRRQGGSQLPWFRDRPRQAIAVASVLFAAIFGVLLAIGKAEDAGSLLYALPVALVALAFGRSAGIGVGLFAVALVVTWAAVRDIDLTWLGWASRGVPLLLLGALLGDASDRLTEAAARQLVLEAAEQRHREATEISDTLIQGMAATKWALEAGRLEAGLRTLEETLAVGHTLVSKLLREADMGLNGYRPPDKDQAGAPSATSQAPR